MRNKGQLGTTLTWIVAFTIIVLILIIYAATSILIGSQKYLSSGNNEIEITSYSDRDLDSFVSLLNSNVDGERFYDTGIKWGLTKDPSLKTKLEEKVKSELNGCYIFVIDANTIHVEDVRVQEISKRYQPSYNPSGEESFTVEFKRNVNGNLIKFGFERLLC